MLKRTHRTRSRSEHGALERGCRTRGKISPEHSAAARSLLLVLLLQADLVWVHFSILIFSSGFTWLA